MRRFTALLTTTVVTLAVGVGGFAGVAVAGEQLSRKEFLKEGNAVCKAATQEINAVFEQAFAGLGENEEPTEEQFAAAAAGAVPVFRTALDEIDGLEGPASLEKQVGKLLGQYNAVVDDIEADPAIGFSSETDPFAKADKLAKKVGLKQCAQNG
jgi:hypothetical protein